MLIYGASGHGKVIADCIYSLGFEIKLCFDDNGNIKEFTGHKVEQYSANRFSSEKLIISIGDNRIRRNISQNVQHLFTSLSAFSAIVSQNAEVGNGTVILQGSIVQSHAKIGNHCIINTSASVDHDCVLDDFVHIAPNSTLCGAVSVGEGTLIGAGSVVIPQTKIGKWSIIGAGSVIINDVPDYSIVVGNPGRLVKKVAPFI